MVLGIAPQVIEDAVLPEPLHGVPILDLPVLDRVGEVVDAAGSGSGVRLLPNVEVEIGHDPGAVLRQPIAALGRAPRLVLERLVHRDHRGDYEAGLHVAGEPHLRVPGPVIDHDGGAGGGGDGDGDGPATEIRRESAGGKGSCSGDAP